MNVAVACGGTGGHIRPGLAVAGALRLRGHAVTLWLGGRDVEALVVDDWAGPVVRVPAAGLPAGRPGRALVAAARLLRAVWQCRRLMRRERPDVVLAMGSYASVGPGLAAAWSGVPLVLHESNAVPGRAIQFLSRFAACTALGFSGAASAFGRRRTEWTGFPQRGDLAPGERPAPTQEPAVLTGVCVGGSQGAAALNGLVPEAVARLRARGVRAQAIHLAGTRDAEAVRARYAGLEVPALVLGFLGAMGAAYRAADVAVTRAGAATCAELAACGVPAVLVPLPTAARDHQSANARELAAAGAAEVVAQAELTPEGLAERLAALAGDAGRRTAMRTALQRLATPAATARVADLVERCAAGIV